MKRGLSVKPGLAPTLANRADPDQVPQNAASDAAECGV